MEKYTSNHPSVERLAYVRELMEAEGMDWLIVYTEGPHLIEGMQECDKIRHYLTGFTGSAGTLLVSADSALLWTDSRYYVQAEMELSGSEIILMKDGEKDVPSIKKYLADHVWPGQCIGVDYKTISEDGLRKLKENIGNSIEIQNATRLTARAFKDKPGREFRPVRIIDDIAAGQSATEKISRVRTYIEENLVEDEESYTYICSDPCSVMWLLNIRGEDIEYTPASFAYLMIDSNMCRVYLNKKALNADVKEQLADRNVIIREYGNFYKEIDEIATDKVVADKNSNNAAIFELLPGYVDVIEVDDYKLVPKHIKNQAEIDGMRKAHLSDAIVMTSFISKLKNNALTGQLSDEHETGKILDDMRLAQPDCIDLSFKTICAYGENGAIVHYTAPKKGSAELMSKGFLLVDSGGQYDNGTTDITRTLALGELTEEEKKVYTLVLKGHLNLMGAKFRPGVRGSNLDILARKPIWDGGYDYGHGTGHGIGCALACHEDPVRISYRATKECELAAGNVVSDEPGVYIEGEFGVRIENALLVVKGDDGRLGFESLTLVPYERDAILPELLSDEELLILNNYHKRVYDMLSPLFNEEQKAWLKIACGEITR